MFESINLILLLSIKPSLNSSSSFRSLHAPPHVVTHIPRGKGYCKVISLIATRYLVSWGSEFLLAGHTQIS
jgi:hypothetical protein